MRLKRASVTGLMGVLIVTSMNVAIPAAVLTSVPASSFPDGVRIDFTTIPSGTPINGQTADGVQFAFSVAGSPSTAATIDGGPGTTNNVAQPEC